MNVDRHALAAPTCELAALGFTGPTQIYEFEDGEVLRAFSDASDPASLAQQTIGNGSRAA